MSSSPRDLIDVEVLEDRAPDVSPTGGFLQLQRLLVRNHYGDGTRSQPYACDIISRRGVDAVTIALYQRPGDRRSSDPRPDNQAILVGLRESLRVPVFLRRHKRELILPDDPPQGPLLETVAGILEPEDAGGPQIAALRRRAACECLEEIGLRVEESAIHDLGEASFPSPGIGDEKVHFVAAEADFSEARPPQGDGSVMEEFGRLVTLPLEEALERCRTGLIPDMKTEIALARLSDRLSRQSV